MIESTLSSRPPALESRESRFADPTQRQRRKEPANSAVAEFDPTGSCGLSGGSCAVFYTPSPGVSQITITAVNSGDGNNGGSTGTFQLSTALTTSSSCTGTTTSASSSALPSSYLAVVAAVEALVLAALALSRDRRSSLARHRDD